MKTIISQLKIDVHAPLDMFKAEIKQQALFCIIEIDDEAATAGSSPLSQEKFSLNILMTTIIL
jgi:hypothetical protein